MRIAYLTSGNPYDKRSWSGIDYYLFRSLGKYAGEMVYLGDLTPRLRLLLGKVGNQASKRLLKKQYAYLQSLFLSRGFARAAEERLAQEPVDLIFVPSASTVAASIRTDKPIIYLSGATFALMQSYYPQFSNLLPLSERDGHVIEQAMIDRSRALLYPTEWPAKSAVDDYGADSSKIHIVPYGANLDEEDVPPSDRILARRRSGQCRLLFLGVDWNRKGGAIAFEALLELEKMGVEAELIVCGCTPPPEFAHERLRTIPFLDKNDPAQRKELNDLFLTSDFLLLPTRQECFGVVFCEASAFGLPSISTHTGGVPGVVVHRENGLLLPLAAEGREYAELIYEAYRDEDRYMELVRSSRRAFEERLNWDAWGRKVGEVIRAVVGG